LAEGRHTGNATDWISAAADDIDMLEPAAVVASVEGVTRLSVVDPLPVMPTQSTSQPGEPYPSIGP
jgi:hypothetical protein